MVKIPKTTRHRAYRPTEDPYYEGARFGEISDERLKKRQKKLYLFTDEEIMELEYYPTQKLRRTHVLKARYNLVHTIMKEMHITRDEAILEAYKYYRRQGMSIRLRDYIEWSYPRV